MTDRHLWKLPRAERFACQRTRTSDLPLTSTVATILFPTGPQGGFQQVPARHLASGQAQALNLYAAAYDAARQQVAERRARRCQPCSN